MRVLCSASTEPRRSSLRKQQSASSLMSLDETPSRMISKPASAVEPRRRVAHSKSMYNLHSGMLARQPGPIAEVSDAFVPPYSPPSSSQSLAPVSSPEVDTRPTQPSPLRRPMSIAGPLSAARSFSGVMPGHRANASVQISPAAQPTRWDDDDSLPSPFLKKKASNLALPRGAPTAPSSRPSLVSRLAMARQRS